MATGGVSRFSCPIYHNAHDHYCLVKNDLAGSWEDLASDVIVANWNFGERDKSLAWFVQLGHAQVIVGYYDESPEKVRDWPKSARQVKGVEGIIYTTWENKYADLERFAEIVKMFQSSSRWKSLSVEGAHLLWLR